jgi:hypothetical protein
MCRKSCNDEIREGFDQNSNTVEPDNKENSLEMDLMEVISIIPRVSRLPDQNLVKGACRKAL